MSTPPAAPPAAGARRPTGPFLATGAVVVIGMLAVLIVRLSGVAGVAGEPSPGFPSATVTVTAPDPSPATSTAPTGTPASSTVRPSSGGPSHPVPATQPTPPPAALTLPIYYVAAPTTATGPRLYREFRDIVPLGAGKITTAVQAMISLPPNDPDYSTLWPAGALVRSVTTAKSIATVDVTAYPSGLGAAAEAAAVSQLVYTVTAVAPSITGVRLRVKGAVPVSGHLDLSGVQTRGNPLHEIANVWILSPSQGQSVTSPVTVNVHGTGWEGYVPIKVFRDGLEVASTSVATRMAEFAEATTTITLPPGTYEVRAYNDNGRDDTLELWDTKTFSVT